MSGVLLAAAVLAGPPTDWNGYPINPNPPFTPTCNAGWPVSYAWIPDGVGSGGKYYEDEELLCEEVLEGCPGNSLCHFPSCPRYTKTLSKRNRRTMKLGSKVEWAGFGASLSREYWTEKLEETSVTGGYDPGPVACQQCFHCGESYCFRPRQVYYKRWSYHQKWLQRYQFVRVGITGYWVKCPGCSVKELVMLERPWPIITDELGLSWEPERMTAAEYCATRDADPPGDDDPPGEPDAPGSLD